MNDPARTLAAPLFSLAVAMSLPSDIRADLLRYRDGHHPYPFGEQRAAVNREDA